MLTRYEYAILKEVSILDYYFSKIINNGVFEYTFNNVYFEKLILILRTHLELIKNIYLKLKIYLNVPQIIPHHN